jgi:hypothetical protein
MLINFLSLFSDGFSSHFKDNVSIFNLIHHQTDLGLHACWTSTATSHGKGAGDGVGAVLKFDVSHSRRILFYLRQWRIQKISEGVAVCRGGRRSRSTNGFQSVFEASELLSFRFYREKIEKKIYEGVAVAGLPTAESATDLR